MDQEVFEAPANDQVQCHIRADHHPDRLLAFIISGGY